VTGPAGAGTPYPVSVTVRLASAGLHVIDRWTDALVDALLDAGAGEPQVGGSLTGGRIEVRLTVDAPDVAGAVAAAGGVLADALAAAETPGVRVLGVSTEVLTAGASGSGAGSPPRSS
jgi:hypothetical protein